MKRVAEGITLVALLACFSIPFSVSAARPDKKSADDAQGAAGIYDKECAKCHGKDGRGKSFKGKMTHARNFTDAKWQDGVTDDQLAKSIADGKDKMPAFGKKLSADEIKSLVSYVREFKGKGSN
jgi:mono/diheme cytochrome c family protein